MSGMATMSSSLNSFFHEVGRKTHHHGNTICCCFSIDSKIEFNRKALILSIIVKTLQVVKRFQIVPKHLERSVLQHFTACGSFPSSALFLVYCNS